jgi:hypothetical protein
MHSLPQASSTPAGFHTAMPYLIFDAKVVEQRLGTGVLPHHNRQASANGDDQEHRQNACSDRRCCQHFSALSRRLFQHPQGLSPAISTLIQPRLAIRKAGNIQS